MDSNDQGVPLMSQDSDSTRGNWILGVMFLLALVSGFMWLARSQGWMDIPPWAFWAVAHTTTALCVILLIILYWKKK
jgi:hypothetical protein